MTKQTIKPIVLAWIAVMLTLLGLVATVVIQSASTAYAFGRMSDKVEGNSAAIIMLTKQNKTLERLDRKVAILNQKIEDDEALIHSIARAVGAKDGAP